MTKKTVGMAEELRRELQLLARHATELRQLAQGFIERADALQRQSETLLRRWARARKRR